MAPIRVRMPSLYTPAKPDERNGTNPRLGRELLTSLGSTTRECRTSCSRTHAHTEAVLAFAAPLVGLIGTFHVR